MPAVPAAPAWVYLPVTARRATAMMPADRVMSTSMLRMSRGKERRRGDE
jgi:hypothetical protein